MQCAVPDIGDFAGEQCPGFAPVGTIVIEDDPGAVCARMASNIHRCAADCWTILLALEFWGTMALAARLSVDIGGTFTDVVLLRSDGAGFSLKISSTPEAPEDAVISGLSIILQESGCRPGDLTEVLHGTTVGSNTLLQKLGATAGLITTKGFRDILEIGRLRTPSMFDLSWDKPEPLIPRRYRREVDERTAADGAILRPIEEEDILQAGMYFRSERIESVAICLLHSYKNPANESRAATIFRETFPDIAVTASIDVLPEAGEYERTSTTVVNAYVLPRLRGYLKRLENKLRALGIDAPLLIGNSNGGLSSTRVAQEKPVFFISSGRASGAVGAARLGAALDEHNFVAFDMGGTTASAALVHRGVLSRTNEYEFRTGMSVPSRFIKAGGYMMRVPTIDVAEVGAGAGSIAAIDAAGLLTVGPLSAGADPGPACYGLGGERPTVTDANIVLGLLPRVLAGGRVTLDVAAASDAIDRLVGRPLALSTEAAAHGIRAVANANMVRAIRAVTVERGLDPRELTLMAFGGSGPVHACDVARSLGIGRVLFPPAPGVFTAMGMLAGTVEHHEIRACQCPLAELDEVTVEGLGRTMRISALAALSAQGYGASDVISSIEIDMRLQGQDAALAIPMRETFDREALRTRFTAAYHDLYGYTPVDVAEVVALRLQAKVRSDHAIDFMASQTAAGRRTQARSSRQVYFDRSWYETPIVAREDITSSTQGPLIIESADTTIVVPPGASIDSSPTGSLIAWLGKPPS